MNTQPPSQGWSKPSALFSSQPTGPASQQPEPATPEQAQAQAHLQMTQTLDLSSKLLKSFWEIQDWSHSRLEKEFKELKQQAENLSKREAAATAQLAEAEKKLKQSDANLEAAMKEKAEAEKKEAEAKRIEAENAKTLERIQPLVEKEKEIIEYKNKALEAFKNAENERKAAEGAHASAAENLKQAQIIKEQILALQSQSWPPSLSSDRWTTWRSSLQEKAKRDANAALVVAAFHRFCAAEKATDPEEVASALQDLGRRLYAETNDPELVAQIGTSFNETAAGKFQLKFAKPGGPTSDQWMNYQPGLGSIRQVRNWAVFKQGPNGFQIASKADVQ